MCGAGARALLLALISPAASGGSRTRAAKPLKRVSQTAFQYQEAPAQTATPSHFRSRLMAGGHSCSTSDFAIVSGLVATGYDTHRARRRSMLGSGGLLARSLSSGFPGLAGGWELLPGAGAASPATSGVPSSS